MQLAGLHQKIREGGQEGNRSLECFCTEVLGGVKQDSGRNQLWVRKGTWEVVQRPAGAVRATGMLYLETRSAPSNGITSS